MAKRGRPRTFDSEEALSKAMREFWARGYSNTSMSHLTAITGLSATSIYAAYGSKEELFFKAVDLYRANEGARIWTAVQNAASPKQIAEVFLRTSADEFTKPGQPRGCLVIMGAILAGAESESVHMKLKQFRRQNEKLLANRFSAMSAGNKAKSGQQDPDWASVARFFMTVQQGMSIQANDGAKRSWLRGVADNAIGAWDTLTGASLFQHP